ncbi:MAG: toprim domain-containing protein [Clostridia bacterium]|jgi:DNA primase
MNLDILKRKLIFKGISGGGKEARFQCPFCENKGFGVDRRGHLYVNLETGSFMCHRCNTRGRKEYLEKFLGLPPSLDITPKEEPAFKEYSTSNILVNTTIQDAIPLSDVGRQYLIDRGLSNEQIEGYKFFELKSLTGRVCIPIIFDNDIVGFQCRSYVHAEPKYLFQPRHIKIHDMLFQWDAAKYYEKVYIVEGIFDAMAIGLNAVSIFGHYLSKKQMELLINSNIEQIYVVLDRDTERESITLSKRLSNYFTEAGYLQWKNIPENFKDIDEINQAFGKKGVDLVLAHQIKQT